MARIIHGDCRTALSMLEEKSVHCCVTSPPYYGLRDYGTATWEGGNTDCDHVESFNKHGGERSDRNQEGYKKLFKDVCGKCGAKRKDSQIGLEETPEEFVQKLVDVFRDVKRVLRDDGTLWLNIGDTYSTGSGGTSTRSEKQKSSQGTQFAVRGKQKGMKSKDLIGIPWMLAFALRADGWYLRQDIIWAKPNPMPESVTDRCTKSHEYIFLLSKSPKYYFDSDSIKEPARNWGTRDRSEMRSGTTDPKLKHHGLQGKPYEENPTRNKRDVWTITTKNFKGAHFATFPPDLIEPCILAGCPPGGVVLDPFGGSGTTGMVAQKNGRDSVLIELNIDYCKMIKDRLEG